MKRAIGVLTAAGFLLLAIWSAVMVGFGLATENYPAAVVFSVVLVGCTNWLSIRASKGR